MFHTHFTCSALCSQRYQTFLLPFYFADDTADESHHLKSIIVSVWCCRWLSVLCTTGTMSTLWVWLKRTRLLSWQSCFLHFIGSPRNTGTRRSLLLSTTFSRRSWKSTANSSMSSRRTTRLNDKSNAPTFYYYAFMTTEVVPGSGNSTVALVL